MNLRRLLFGIFFITFMFFALGIAGNMDREIDTPTICWVILIVSGVLTLFQAKYLESKGDELCN